MTRESYLLLLYSRLRGNHLHPEEQALLDTWLEESAEHRQMAAQIEKLWLAQAETSAPPVDIQAELRKLHHRIEREEIVSRAPKRRYLRLIAAAAAVVAILFATVLLIRDQAAPSKEDWTLISNPGDSKREILLPDGSKVWLNRHSSLRFPKTFSGGREAEMSGEAYFEIQRDPAHPFSVDAGICKTEVLGTRFNVRALAGQNDAEIALIEGKVRVSQGRAHVDIEAGQTAYCSRDESPLRVVNSLPSAALAWHSGEISFENTSLEEAIRQLNRLFDTSIVLDNTDLGSCPYSAFFPSLDLEAILENLQAVFNVQIEKRPKAYLLREGRCGQ